MKRSAQPLPSGAATKDGLERMPRTAQLLLKMVAQVLAAVVVAESESPREVRLVAVEVLPEPLPQRLQRLEARARSRRVDADALLRAVIDGDEDGGVPLAGGEAGGRVGPPHLVRPLGGDRPVVHPRSAPTPDAGRGEQSRLPHQPQMRVVPYGRPVEGEVVRLITSTSGVPRESCLQLMRALEQELVRHRDLADFRLQSVDLLVTLVGRPARERGPAGGE